MQDLKTGLFLLVLLAGVLSTDKCVAQFKYAPGYIIMLNNDSVVGKIRLQSEKQARDHCYFKKGDQRISYSANEILEYGIYRENTYISNVVEDEFATVLIRGKLSLYSFDNTLYIQKVGGDVVELEKKELVVEDEGRSKIRDDTRWKGALLALTTDCPLMRYRINRLKLYKRDIVRIVSDYNKCVGADNIVASGEFKPISTKIGLQLGGVVQRNRLNDNYSTLTYDPANTLSFVGGVNVEFKSAYVNQRLTLDMGLNMYQSRSNFSSSNEDLSFTEEVFTKQNVVNVPVSIRSTLPMANDILFVFGGLNFSVYQNTKLLKFQDVVEGDEINIYFDERNETASETELMLGGGVQPKLFAFFGTRFYFSANVPIAMDETSLITDMKYTFGLIIFKR